MKNQQILWVLFPFLLLLTNCKNDTDIIDEMMPEEPTVLEPGVTVNTTIAGFIFDENNNPLDEVEVRSGTSVAYTDINGFYVLNNITANSKDTYITTQRDGYIHNSRRIYPTNQSTFTLDFKLLRQNADGVMSAGEGKEVDLPNGAKLVLSANSVSHPDGSAYNGDVHISLDHLSPNDDDLVLTMPGDLTAVDAEGNLKVLATYGMLSVELSTDTGEPLQLSTDMTATLSFPVPSNLIGNAPTTIPLWHFDEMEGRWIEEGTATLEGNIYVGSVSHFSFWNCDAPFDVIFVSGKVLDQDGEPIQNLYIESTINSSGITKGGTIDSEGNFGGLMPKDEEMNLNFKSIFNPCGSNESLFNQNIGPFSSATDLGTITVQENSNSVTQISGTLLDCDGELLENAYLKLNFDGTQYLAHTNTGEFILTYPNCQYVQLTIEAIDVTTGNISIPLTFSNTSSIQTGPITVCEGSNLSCLLTEDDFSGLYELSYIGDASGGFGIPFTEGPVTINIVNESVTKRSFNLNWGPDIGGFQTADFVFDFVCDEVVVEEFFTGLGCGVGEITIVQGDPSPVDLTNDEEIILNIIEYQNDGGCGVPPELKTIRLVKQ